MDMKVCEQQTTAKNTFIKCSAFADKVERNCHFPAPDWNFMTHRLALQGFADTSRVSLHKNNKINLPFFLSVPAGSRKVAVALNFISERTVLIIRQE
jgi:hypothetical protein